MTDKLFLSRVSLPARTSYRRLSDCHEMHRFVMRAFPQAETQPARAELGVLYRVEQSRDGRRVAVLVQSAVEPAWAIEDEGCEVDGPRPLDAFLGAISEGARYRFRLFANPTKRVSERATRDFDPARGRNWLEKPASAGKRVAIRDDEARMEWLTRKAEAGGFRLVRGQVSGGTDNETREPFADTRVDAPGMQFGRSGDRRFAFETCRFDGLLEVTDAALLANAVRGGIGSGKAFGCGLLSLAPVPPP
jgi:CRISPR system Cascade subunit CasE